MEIISDVERFIKKSLEHKEEYFIEVRGHKLLIHPQVLSPSYSYSSQFVIDNWDVAKGMDILEIGTGSGILALFAALEGVNKVLAVDKNPHSVRIARKNMELNKVDDRVNILESDGFDSVEGLFDRIIFNAPYFDKEGDSKNLLTFAVYDKDYGSLRKFLTGAKDHLKRNGELLVAFSELGKVRKIEKMIGDLGYSIDRKISEEKGHIRLLYYLSSD